MIDDWNTFPATKAKEGKGYRRYSLVHYGCTVYLCKSVLHCVFKVLSVSPSHEVELLICVGCFDNVLLYMLTKS